MKRERIVWTVSVLLMSILALNLSYSFAARDDEYAFVRRLIDIQRQVLNNYVDPVQEPDLQQAAIDGMLDKLDPYTVYIPPGQQEQFDRAMERSFTGVGITLSQGPEGIIQISPIDDSPALSAGILPGDILLKVDGEQVKGLTTNQITKKISGQINTAVTLTVLHPSQQQADVQITRQQIVVPTVTGYSRNTDNSWNYYLARNPDIAYVRVSQFTGETMDRLQNILSNDQQTGLIDQGAKGLIIDLRWNPGGLLDQATQMVDLFVADGVIVSTRGRNRPEQIKKASAAGTLPDFPIVVLVNEHSASAAEIVSGSLRDNHRATIVGQRTFGKGSVQEVIKFDNGNDGELKLTVAYYYLPSGRLVHKLKDAKDWGVEPNLIVPLDESQQESVLTQIEQREERHPIYPPGITPPLSRPTTTSQPATTQATQPAADTQLEMALLTMRGLIASPTGTTLPATSAAMAPTSRPATLPTPPASQTATQPSRLPPESMPAEVQPSK